MGFMVRNTDLGVTTDIGEGEYQGKMHRYKGFHLVTAADISPDRRFNESVKALTAVRRDPYLKIGIVCSEPNATLEAVFLFVPIA